MADLKKEFEAAVAYVQDSPSKAVSNDIKLKMYALFKQATSGDVSGKKPGMLDPVGRAKYNAWAELQGVSADLAMAQYINMVAELKG